MMTVSYLEFPEEVRKQDFLLSSENRTFLQFSHILLDFGNIKDDFNRMNRENEPFTKRKQWIKIRSLFLCQQSIQQKMEAFTIIIKRMFCWIW